MRFGFVHVPRRRCVGIGCRRAIGRLVLVVVVVVIAVVKHNLGFGRHIHHGYWIHIIVAVDHRCVFVVVVVVVVVVVIVAVHDDDSLVRLVDVTTTTTGVCENRVLLVCRQRFCDKSVLLLLRVLEIYTQSRADGVCVGIRHKLVE